MTATRLLRQPGTGGGDRDHCRSDGVEAELFAAHAKRLVSVVGAIVRTSPVNVEDACGFAWLQLLRYRPTSETAFGWLCTTAIREAIRLDRRARRLVELEQLSEWPASDPRLDPEQRDEVLAAVQVIAAAELGPRERRLVGLRALGYTRRQMVALTGESHRTVDRRLVRAQRKLRDAMQGLAEVG